MNRQKEVGALGRVCGNISIMMSFESFMVSRSQNKYQKGVKGIGKTKFLRLQKGKSVRIQVSYRPSKNESMRNICND